MDTRARAGRRIEFRVLGPLEVDAGEGPLSLGGPKQRAVLANLVVRANQVVPVETLIDEIWGDEPPEGARHTLQTYVSNLRSMLGEDRLRRRAPGYVLSLEPADLDAWRFDELVRDAKEALPIDPSVALATLDDALRLWRGPALADVADRASLLAEAARLDDLRIEAMESRIQGLLASGENGTAIGEIEALLARDPLRESLWGSLMLALYRDERQGDALNAYQRAREVLADELGIDPSPELVRLHERILRQDPELEPKGESLRGYRLLESIGEGSTGSVFRALQSHVGRDVAIKLFHERVAADPTFVRRFEHDAQAVVALEHPHIVPVYDYWREPGRAYIVSRYLRGGSLAGLLERAGEVPLERGLRLLEQIAGALAFVHRQGMVHGALHASNVLLDAEGNAYLSDLRIGTVAEADATHDVTDLALIAGAILGSAIPRRLADVVDRADVGIDVPDAAAFLEAVRVSQDRRPASPVAMGEARNPYKGLRPFTEADERDFFGRGRLVERLVARLNDAGPGSRFLAVVGPSGSGKSSAVLAGLVPAIRRGAISDVAEPSVVELTPGDHPLDELASALVRIAVRSAPKLHEVLDDGPRGLLEAVDLLGTETSEVVVVIDQFEELFTVARDERERERFLEALRVATADPQSRVRVIVTLRADLYDRPLAYPRFGELLAERTEAVPPLTPDELERATRQPAEREGVRPDPGLVAEMVADVVPERAALPLLQYALTELFERRSGARLTLEAYREIGGIAGALSARAERAYAETDAEGRRAIRQVFLRLVTLGEGRPDTKRRVPVSALHELDVDPTTVDGVLDTFGRHRFLTFDRDAATREPTVEIAHEALLGAWERLSRWIDDAREDLRWERQLARASAEWRASGRDPSFLLRGARLERIEVWAKATGLAIARRDRAFLKASVDQRSWERSDEERVRNDHERIERRSRARLRALVAVFAVAAVVASSLTIVATEQNARAARGERLARARELAAASIANLEADPELSILLALRAVDETRAEDGSVLREAEDALHQAVEASRVVQTLPGVVGPIAWGGGLFAAESPRPGGGIDVYDATSGDVVRTIEVGARVTDLAFDRTDDVIAATTDAGELGVWLAGSGRRVVRISGEGPATGVSFDRGAGLVAAAWRSEDVARVVDVRTGSVVSTARVASPTETALAPDGTRLAVAHRYRVDVLDVGRPTRPIRRLSTSTGNALRYDVAALAWSPDGRYLASASTFLDVWDAVTGRLTFSRFAGVRSAAWSPDSARLVTGTSDGSVRIWVMGSFDPIGDLVLSATELRGGEIGGVAFSAGGDRVIASSANGTAAKVWDVSLGGDREWLNLPGVPYYADIAFTSAGRDVLAIGPGGRVVRWDVQTGATSEPIGPVVGDWESSFDVSPDGRSIAFAYSERITAWDVASGDRLFARVFPYHVDRVDWSPDGAYLVVPVDDERSGVTILDRTGAVAGRLDVPSNVARFGADGRLLAVGHYDEVQIWDWRARSMLRSLPAHGWDMAFAPTGDRIVTVGTEEGSPPELWDLAAGTSRFLEGHGGEVQSVAFSPDGSTVATGGMDGSIHLFDASSGAELLVLRGHPAGVRGVAFSPDGSRLASVSPTLARVWALDIDDLISIARANVTRPLNAAECGRYFGAESCSG
jgi:DNA-binding SARP family transcriptional activator/WD40 repeat protein